MIVIDASAALSLVFPDEVETRPAGLSRLLEQEQTFAPAIWPLEVANAIASAVKKQRISKQDILPILSSFEAMSVQIETANIATVFANVLPLAEKHGLSVYDAAYLDLAIRTGARIATLDRRLATAARAEGVELGAQPV